MSTIIPIQVTLQAANAADYRQLVQDLAGTLSSEQVAANASAPVQQPVQQAHVQQQPVQQQSMQSYSAVPTSPLVQQAPIQQQAPLQQQAPVQQAPVQQAQQYDAQQLAVAATALMEAGHNIPALLQQFGVQALTQLPKERFGEFATVLRQMGAKI